MNYFTNKERNMSHAKEVSEYCTKHYPDFIHDSVINTIYYPEMLTVPKPIEKDVSIQIDVIQETTTDAIFDFKECKSMAVLNFASYKNPGGMFIEGSMAQEESLCHESFLYNVLSSKRLMELFYIPHQKMLNKSLYHSDLLYSPRVRFERKGQVKFVDVITCAAPNKKAAQKYQAVPDAIVHRIMYNRIDSLLYAAADQRVPVLVLGAFGCGVFGNDLEEVSLIFATLLNGKYRHSFEKVIFAVPDKLSFLTMKKYLGKM